MEMHGRLGRAGTARGEPKQRNIVLAGFDRIEFDWFFQRQSIEFCIVVGGSVEADNGFEKWTVLGAGGDFIHQPGVA